MGLDRSTDTQILERARQHGQTVVTADLDYPRLLALTSGEGPSLILFRGGDWSEPEVTARMQQILHTMGESETMRSIVVVDRVRVRRRRLANKITAAGIRGRSPATGQLFRVRPLRRGLRPLRSAGALLRR